MKQQVIKTKKSINRKFFHWAVSGILIPALLFQLSACASNNATSPTQTKSKTTIMIYMVGADLESENGLASLELDEIADSGVDTSSNTILVNVGGASEWKKKNIDSGSVYVLDNETWKLAEDYQEANMGDPDTLTRFVKYGMDSYKADISGLIIWNHGGGPVVGCGYDEVYDDLLTLPEIKNALGLAGLGNENKLDFIGFDACLMGSLEVANSIHEYANYMIASQETIPGLGWNYSFLEKLDHCSNGEEIGQIIIDSYYEFYELLSEIYPELTSDITLSCVDLSKSETVEHSLNELFREADLQLNNDRYADFAKCRNNTKEFGKFSTNDSYDLIDVCEMINNLPAEYEELVSALTGAIDEYVCYNRSNVDKANGISVFHPFENKFYVYDWMSEYENLEYASDYTQYLKDFVKERYSFKETDKKTFMGSLGKGQSEKNEDRYAVLLSLTPEQIQNFSYAEYQLVRKDKEVGEDAYMLIFSDKAELTEDGDLMAECGKALFVSADNDDNPIPLQYVFDNDFNNRYFLFCNFYKEMYDSNGDFEGLSDIDLVKWQVRINQDKPQLCEAVLVDYDSPVAQKELIDYKDYSYIEYFAPIRTPAYDKDGSLCAFDEWESTGFVESMEYDIETITQGTEYRTINNSKGDYSVYFTIYDIYGNEYRTDLIPLQTLNS